MRRRISGPGARRVIAALVAAGACALSSVALAGGGKLLSKPHFAPNGLTSTGPIAVADLNGDGRKDIVTAGHDDQSISVLYGAKHGFKAFKTYSSYVPTWLAIGDVNRDGRPDIVYSTDENTPQVMLAKHGGGFGPSTSVGSGHAAYFAVLVDLNHDHKLDLVTSNAAPDNNLSVFTGKGNGKFGTASDVPLPVDGEPSTLVPADLNGDGDRDLAVLVNDTAFQSVVSILDGDGHAAFVQGNTRIIGAQVLFGMAAGHFNSDDRLDLAGDLCGAVYLMYGTKTGFTNPDKLKNDSNACPVGPAAGDLNGDGRTDLVTTDEALEGRKVSVMLGKRGGGLGPFHLYPALKDGVVSRYVAIADFNKDGRNDVAVPGDNGTKQGVGVVYGKRK
jgi:hypothetical protein